jgi:hypothetical protein
MRRSFILAAGYVVLFASTPTANAAPTYSVFNCTQPSATPQSTPQSIDGTCTSSIGFAETAARADAGSVGANSRSKQTLGNSLPVEGGAGASFYTDEIVISKLPSAGTLPDQVYIALRFDVDGVLDVPAAGQARAQVIGSLGTISGNTSFANNSGNVTSEIYFYTVIENNSSGDVIKLVLETGKLLVNAGSLIDARLSTNVSTFASELNEATSDFMSTVTFAQGRDVFAFYDANGNPLSGYTANAGSYLVNNRFGNTNGTVPEPGTLALLGLGLGLAGLAAARRRRQ